MEGRKKKSLAKKKSDKNFFQKKERISGKSMIEKEKTCPAVCKLSPNESRILEAVLNYEKNEKFILDSIDRLTKLTEKLSDLLIAARLKIAGMVVITGILSSAITGIVVSYFKKG